MARNINSWYDNRGAYFTYYPTQPNFCESCPVNVKINTLPDEWTWHETIMGPSSVKHLYTGIPNFYPPMTLSRPVGTMYDSDLSSFGAHGRRETYGFQAYPYHSFSPREVRIYSDTFLPVPNIFEYTKYNTVRDGAWGR